MSRESLKNLLKQRTRAVELDANIHENVVLVSMDINDRVDHTGNKIKKQLFLMFKKLDDEGNVIGEKDVSFFIVDPVKDFALDNLVEFITHVKAILSPFVTEKDLQKKFNPMKVLLEKDEKITADVEKEFYFDNIRDTRLKKLSNYGKVEKAIRSQAGKLISSKIGFNSIPLRLKLVEDKNNYIQLPRFGAFIESMEVEKSESILTK